MYETMKTYLPLLIPVLAIHFTLAIIALVDLVKRRKVRFNNKFVWAIIIIIIEIFGSVIYFLARGDEE